MKLFTFTLNGTTNVIPAETKEDAQASIGTTDEPDTVITLKTERCTFLIKDDKDKTKFQRAISGALRKAEFQSQNGKSDGAQEGEEPRDGAQESEEPRETKWWYNLASEQLGVSADSIKRVDAVFQKGCPELQKALFEERIGMAPAATIARKYEDHNDQLRELWKYNEDKSEKEKEREKERKRKQKEKEKELTKEIESLQVGTIKDEVFGFHEKTKGEVLDYYLSSTVAGLFRATQSLGGLQQRGWLNNVTAADLRNEDREIWDKVKSHVGSLNLELHRLEQFLTTLKVLREEFKSNV